MSRVRVAGLGKPVEHGASAATQLVDRPYCDSCNGHGKMLAGDYCAGGVILQCQCGYEHKDSAFAPLLVSAILVSILFSAFILISI